MEPVSQVREAASNCSDTELQSIPKVVFKFENAELKPNTGIVLHGII